MNLPTDTQLNNHEFVTLNRETDYDDRSGGRSSQNELEALMRMVKKYPPTGSVFKRKPKWG